MAQKFVPIAQKNVAIAGTALQITTNNEAAGTIIFQADPGNNKDIYLGDSTVDATNGLTLGPGDIMEINGDARQRGGQDEFILSDWYVDAAANNQSVRMFRIRRRIGSNP